MQETQGPKQGAGRNVRGPHMGPLRGRHALSPPVKSVTPTLLNAAAVSQGEEQDKITRGQPRQGTSVKDEPVLREHLSAYVQFRETHADCGTQNSLIPKGKAIHHPSN